MSLAAFDNLLHQLEALPTPPIVHLGGYGEPMTHPFFLEMVRHAKGAGLRVEVTTNGSLLDARTAAELIDLDLDRLMVSLDGAVPESYGDVRAGASFTQVMDNMRTLYRLKLRKARKHSNPQVGIAFVAMKRNVGDLAQLPRLATQIGAWSIQVSNLVPHTAEMEDEILYRHALTACAFRASRWVPDMSLPKLDLNEHTTEPLRETFASTASISLLGASLSAANDYCRFAHQGYAVVRWDGEVSPCLELMHDHPVYVRGRRKDVTHLSVGNIEREPLSDIWNSEPFGAHRTKLRAFRFSPCSTCGGCERFAENLTDCTENIFPACGGCLWAQGFIQCP
jgi:MoaA/NifB/PqqE/SkfB family radical SAM enzyme